MKNMLIFTMIKKNHSKIYAQCTKTALVVKKR